MADDPAALTQEQKERIAAWLKARGVPRPCSMCGANSWTLANHLVTPPIYRSGGSFMFGGPAYPQAMLMCTICAHTVYFNAVVMGILQSEPAKEPSPADPPKESSSNG